MAQREALAKDLLLPLRMVQVATKYRHTSPLLVQHLTEAATGHVATYTPRQIAQLLDHVSYMCERLVLDQ